MLDELPQVEALLARTGRSDVDAPAADRIIEAAGRFASEMIAPLNLSGDRVGRCVGVPSASCAGAALRMPPKSAVPPSRAFGWSAISDRLGLRRAAAARVPAADHDLLHARKLDTARFHGQRLRPQILALAAGVRAGAASVMADTLA